MIEIPTVSAHSSQANPVWFGDKSQPLFGLINFPTGPLKGTTVICPPLGYEAWTSYQSLRVLAESLASKGFVVLRFDYHGSGDSSGEELQAQRVNAWRSSIQQAVQYLRQLYPKTDVALAGLRFGGTLAAEQAASVQVDTVALWDPVVSGRRHVRELKVMAFNDTSEEASDGIMEIAGCLYSPETIQDMSAIDLTKCAVNARSILLLERDDRPANTALLQHLSATAQVDHQAVTGMASMMNVSTEDAQVPLHAITQIVSWLDAQATGAPMDLHQAIEPTKSARTQFKTDDDVLVQDEAVYIPPLGLFAMLGQPANQQPKHIVIFLSSGTEHRIGPGRAWIHLSRHMNQLGVATLRIDFDGVGESPVRGTARNVRPYDPQFFDDIRDCISFLRSKGFEHITVLGLCSGAWMAVQSGIQLDVNAVVAINPQLYWQQGDPVESLLQDTRIRCAPMRAHEKKWERYGVWTALDICGIRPLAGQWLDALVKKKIRTLLAFAEADDGLQYLQMRCKRRLDDVLHSNIVSMVEIAGIDHPMHRHRRRPAMFKAITDFVLDLKT